MRLVWSLLQNPHLHVEPYLHQLMPSVVTCLVAKRLGNRLADNHWELRDFTATIVACICRRFSHVYNNLQTRLTKTLLHAFLDPKRAITQHYGAIQGLGALGPNVVRLLVVPNLETYLRLLEPEMVLEKQKNEMKRREAWRVYGALLCAAGQSIYDRLKMFPSMPSSPAGTIWKTNSRMIHSCPANKRKMPADQLEQPPLKKIGNDDGPLFPLEQPPLKKIGNDDGALFPLANNSSDMETDKGAAALGNSSAGFSSPKEISDSASEKRQRRGEPEKQILKTPALLNQAWEDDLDSGRLLILLFELFGESIFPFIPMPEMAFFL
ncbi:hypothetical protein ACH5RR_037196 [Cinchona calisaya]|uniref:TAF6 C-terminal HEAT repeat domain-containing protein n=1 Tax=Cinchona calisaya TaxID=153742 RepID=A0ABD2Y8J4_9GENT